MNDVHMVDLGGADLQMVVMEKYDGSGGTRVVNQAEVDITR